MQTCWVEDTPLNLGWVKSALDLRLNDIDLQNWNNEVYKNRLCLNYRLFKQEGGLGELFVLKLPRM